MKKSKLRELIRETIKEGFRDPEDNYGFPEKPEYFDAFLYFEDLAEKKGIPLTISNFAQFLDKHTDSIPDSLLKVINVETIKESGRAYGIATLTTGDSGAQHSPWTKTGKPPGVWEEDGNEPKGPWSAGLEAREIADSFTFDEIEQLYKDGLIDSSNYNGSKWILQGWIDTHPTYLPQRDLTSPKRQRIRARYDTSAAGLIPGDPDWPGEDDRDNFPDQKHLKENKEKHIKETKMKSQKLKEAMAFNAITAKKKKIPMSFTDIADANAYRDANANIIAMELIKETEEKYIVVGSKGEEGKGPFQYGPSYDSKEKAQAVADKKNKQSKYTVTGISFSVEKGSLQESTEENENSAIQYYLDQFIKDIEEGGRKGGTEYLNDVIKAIANLRDTFEYYADKAGVMESYIKERGDDNLMEHMDRYRKRVTLMEGAWKDINPMFKADKTDDEIVQYYVNKGVAPEHVNKLPGFVAKLRNHWNSITKIKTDIEILDQEAEGFKHSTQPSVSGMEAGIEEKDLASGLFNENNNK